MKKILEKILHDAIKEKSVIIGSKQILNSLDKVKLIVSSTTKNSITDKISSDAEKLNIPIIRYDGNSVDNKKYCHGIYTDTEDRHYDGMWVNNKMHGHGKVTTKDGDLYCWRMEKFQGRLNR